MSENIIRVPIEEAGGVQLADVHIVGAVGRHDDSHRYVELMSDLQHIPIDSPSGAEGAPNLLLVEVDDPNDPECLRKAMDILAQHEHFEQRRHRFKHY